MLVTNLNTLCLCLSGLIHHSLLESGSQKIIWQHVEYEIYTEVNRCDDPAIKRVCLFHGHRAPVLQSVQDLGCIRCRLATYSLHQIDACVGKKSKSQTNHPANKFNNRRMALDGAGAETIGTLSIIIRFRDARSLLPAAVVCKDTRSYSRTRGDAFGYKQGLMCSLY